MRVSRKAAAASKTRITREAARLMREQGISATSVADVMTAAGMTTGGFYKHFASKDDLAAAAVREAFDTILAALERAPDEDMRAKAGQAYFTHYLSACHIENPGMGCPVAALGADGPRGGDLLAAEFRSGIDRTLQALGGRTMTREDRAHFIRHMSRLLGALILARAVGKGPLRDEIITAARASLQSD